MTTLSKFGDEFQLKVLHHLLHDTKFAAQIIEIIDPEFFSKDSYSWVCSKIRIWNEEYSTLPTIENLKTITNVEFEQDEIQREFLLTVLDEILSQSTIVDQDFIEEKTLEFCKQQAMKNAILECVELLKADKLDQIPVVIEKAQAAGAAQDLGHSYEHESDGRIMDRRYPVATNLGYIDKYTVGGLASGELGLIMAGTNVGKSMMLAFLAAEAFRQGKNVAIVTLEMNEKLYGLRIDARLSGIDLSALTSDSVGKYRPKVRSVIDKLRSKFDVKPRMFIKEYPTKTASVLTIKNYLASLRFKDFKPDVLFIDYSDLLKPNSRYNEKRFELESNVEQLRGLAGQLNIPVWSATQTNRDGLDSSIVSLQHISEALSKAMVADLVISIGRTDELAHAGRACYYLAKNRNGPSKIAFEGPFNTSILDFSIDKEGLDVDEIKTSEQRATMNKVLKNVLTKNANSSSDFLDTLGEK